ncbi:MAG: TonB-dependent receptor [Alteromonadaceae bacterium]|nr:TonB-dependent receptor [Alteromonadaceae bacterium]
MLPHTTKSLLAIAISLAFSNAVLAEDSSINNKNNDKSNDQTIEEVTVIAKKSSLANNVVSPAMLDQQISASSVLSVMDNLPGISINEGDAFGGDDWSTSITMRGFSIDGTQQQLGMTVDGIPNGGSNYGGGAKANRYLDSENMSTVEVTQGTSDLSSASLEALGGTFNFVSSDPTEEKGTTFAITNGDHNAKRYFVRQNFGQFLGNTTAYASYSSTKNNRWIGTGSNGGADRQHAAFKFISDLGKLQLTGRLSYDDVAEDNYNSVTLEQFKQTPDWDQLTWNWTGIPHFDQMFAEGWSTLRKNTLGYLKFSYDISATSSFNITPYIHKNTGRGDWIPPYLVNVDGGNVVNQGRTINGGAFASRYGFTNQQGEQLSPNAGCTDSLSWPWESGPGLNPACYGSSAVPVMSYRHTHYKKDRTGVLSDYSLSIGIHDLKFGLWLENNVRKESRDWHKVIDARVYQTFDNTPYWVQYSNKFTTNTAKWFAQDTMTLGKLTVNAGVQKYLVDIEKYDVFAKAVTGKVNSDSKVLFSLGGLYLLSDTVELFSGYSENFSAIKDGVLERESSSLTNIKPETAKNIDLGIRYNDQDLSLSATVYDIKFNDRITFIAPGSGSAGIDYTIGTNGSYLNVGGIKSTGVELSASYHVNNHWDIYSSYTNNNSTYVGNAPGYTAGDKVIDSVDNMFVLSTEYFSGNLRFGTSAKYTSARGDAPQYTVVDANIGYTVNTNGLIFKSVDLAFVVNNLLDERYLSTGTGTGTTFFIGASRTAAFTLTANF